MLANPETVRMLDKWQKKLHLTQWDIKLTEMDFNAAGYVAFSAASLGAKMIINKQDKWTNGEPHDKEKSIVHELLHLQFSLFEPEEDTPEFCVWHQTIELMANLLVDFERRTDERNTKTD